MNIHTGVDALPDALEAQQVVLGAIMSKNDEYWRVAGFLKPEHFGGPREPNRILYETIATLIAGGRPASCRDVRPYIEANLMIGEITFYEYAVRLQGESVGTFSVYESARAVIEMHARHQLIALGDELRAIAMNMPVSMSPEKIISEAADKLTTIAQESNEKAGALKYGVLLPKAVTAVQKASVEQTSRIPWFLPEITQVVGEPRRGNLTGFMSDSGGGKTSFSIQQGRYAALHGFKSAFFSIEITEDEAALQAAGQATGITLERMDEWRLDTKEESRLEAEMMETHDIPYWIVPFAECSLTDIRIKAEAMKKRTGLDQVIIDHAKMIQLPGRPGDLFAERVNGLYRGLKSIAKSLDINFVILIQRNEEWKARMKAGGSARPMMGDAYGGSGVRQNLDQWFSLYRPEPIYKEAIANERNATKREELIGKYDISKNKAWLINHKRRRGEPNQSQMIEFEAQFTRFKSIVNENGNEETLLDFAAGE